MQNTLLAQAPEEIHYKCFKRRDYCERTKRDLRRFVHAIFR